MTRDSEKAAATARVQESGAEPASEEFATTTVESPIEPPIEPLGAGYGEKSEGVANSADVASEPFEEKPDVSNLGYEVLLHRLLQHFDRHREKLARALGLHRSTVDRWLNGTSRPNMSTILRMRRLVQERHLE